MNLLLDTHTFLWFYGGDAQLSQKLKLAIMNPSINCYISIASLWEITIKFKLGKLELKDSLEALFQFVKRNNITIIDIKTEHLLQINLLPFFHKDPFDRIIIAQGIVENLQIASKDSIFTEYPVSVVW